jgi:hypothetical protein
VPGGGGKLLEDWGSGSATGSAAGIAVAKAAKSATRGVVKCMVVLFSWYWSV